MLSLSGQPICDHTGGEFATEPEAWADLDARLEALAMFKVYPEVWGFPIQPRLDTELKELRIDRLLIPLQKAINQGWRLGAVGIEAKCSGKKLGPLINQGLDYARAAWHLPLSHVTVMTSWTFLWPCSRFGGDLESVAVSNRIGVAYSDTFARLVLNVGGMNVLRFSNDGDIACKMPKAGGKAGSR